MLHSKKAKFVTFYNLTKCYLNMVQVDFCRGEGIGFDGAIAGDIEEGRAELIKRCVLGSGNRRVHGRFAVESEMLTPQGTVSTSSLTRIISCSARDFQWWASSAETSPTVKVCCLPWY